MTLTGSGNNKHGESSQFPSYNGLVMCGYQGWFRAKGDGSNSGWGHYGIKGKFDDNNVKVDLWPDVTEYEKPINQFLTLPIVQKQRSLVPLIKVRLIMRVPECCM